MTAQPLFDLDALNSGATPALWFRDSALTTLPNVNQRNAQYAIFAGSFNPLHDGHLEIARVAAEILKTTVYFEISICNVDKPDLAASEVAKRLACFPADAHVAVTRAMKFAEKCQLFPGATFVVGADTIRRIADPKYSGGDSRRMLDAIDQISSAGCRFLVFGRLFESAFQELDRVPMPESLMSICQGVEESRFRCDISSTELRKNQPD